MNQNRFNYLVAIALLLIVAWIFTGCTTVPKPCDMSHEPPLEIQKLKAKKKKQYIVFDSKNLYRPPNQVSAMSATFKAAAAKSMGGEIIRDVPNSNAFVIQVDEGKATPTPPAGLSIQEENVFHTYETLYRLTPVECPPTNPQPNPTPTPTPGPITNTTWGQKAVRAGEASAITVANTVHVCDIDTGLDRSVHSQFPTGTIRQGMSMVPNEPWDIDPGKHGTHTAGTIASTKYGVTRVSLSIVKALANSGTGTSSWLAGAVNQCRTWGAKVINASWGMDQGSDSLIASAVSQFVSSGGIFVAAAGNSGGPIGFPANMQQAIAVTSMDESGRLSSFSSRGFKNGEMYLAPGGGVLSLCPNGTCTMSDTSMAAPHVTAIMALRIARGRSTIGVINRGLPTTEQGRGQADALLTVQ